MRWLVAAQSRVVSPQGFFVEGKEGPIKDGELSRAIAWGRHLAADSESGAEG